MVLKSGSGVTFVFSPGSPIKQASVVGTFNGWDLTADPMQRMPDGSFRTVRQLDPGRYEYRYYADGIFWSDSDAEAQVLNPYGTLNSVIIVNER